MTICSLTLIPDSIEIKIVVFSLDANSIFGPNGCFGLFFQQFWEMVGMDMVEAIRAFFHFGLHCSRFKLNLYDFAPVG